MANATILKEKILEVAKGIAYQEGISAINMRRIASEAHISVGAIYNHYATKGDVIAAVIGDFWMRAFNVSKIEFCDNASLVDSVEAIYLRLAEVLIDYKNIWLGQLTKMEHGDKKIGKDKEQAYFLKIQETLLEAINKDPNISKSLWDNGLTKEEFARFLMTNMLDLLKRDQRDCTTFIHILNRILYS